MTLDPTNPYPFLVRREPEPPRRHAPPGNLLKLESPCAPLAAARPQTVHRSTDLGSLAGRYDLVLCDVFGVLHDADQVYAKAAEALTRARRRGMAVVLISNSVLCGAALRRSLEARGIAPEICDAAVTSGDVTRNLLRSEAVSRIYHLGPTREAVLLDGLDLELVPVRDAELIVCTGFEEPADDDARAALLASARKRNLVLVCTNPDRLAETPTGPLRFAGLIAEAYESLGGRVVLTGKPDRSIYVAAVAEAERIRDGPIEADRILAIGDAWSMDIAGAVACGFDAVWITLEGAAGVDESLARPSVRRMAGLAW